MGYIPPSYEQLQQSTGELQQIFNKAANRYEPPAYDLLLEKISKMQKNYCLRVKEKKNLFFAREPDLVRFEEIACITRLIDSFPETAPGSIKRHYVHNILLGALFYRRKAIEDSYRGSVSSCLRISNERYSALYLTIEEMLGLHPDHGSPIDTLTIATCCRAYFEHLRSIDLKKQSLYVRPEELDFFPHLEVLIDVTEKESREVASQMNGLESIQTIADLLSKTNRDVRLGLDLLSARFIKAWGTKEILSREDMIKILQATDLSPVVKAMIDYLIADDKTLSPSEAPLFVEEMQRHLTVYNQFTLLGAYVMTLKKVPVEQAHLKRTLHVAINASSIRNALDETTKTQAICALNDYLALPGMRELTANGLPHFEAMKCELRLQVSEFHSLQELTTSVAAFN
jgi:hypothetical protein